MHLAQSLSTPMIVYIFCALFMFQLELGPLVWNQLTDWDGKSIETVKKRSGWIIYGKNFKCKFYSDDVWNFTFVWDQLSTTYAHAWINGKGIFVFHLHTQKTTTTKKKQPPWLYEVAMIHQPFWFCRDWWPPTKATAKERECAIVVATIQAWRKVRCWSWDRQLCKTTVPFVAPAKVIWSLKKGP